MACECEAGSAASKLSGVPKLNTRDHVLRQHRGVQGDATADDWEKFRVAMYGVGKAVPRRELRKASVELGKLAAAAGFPDREPGCDDDE
mgnify:FL=1